MLNMIILQGNLTSDPQVKQSSNGKSYVQFQIAVNEYYNQKQTVDYISCTAFSNTAEFIGKYFQKGSQIIVEGSLHQNNYTDSNGVTHYNMQVTVNRVNFCGVKSADTDSQQPNAKHLKQELKENDKLFDFSINDDDFETF